MEDNEYLKLPVEDRCVHKLWKARVSGYEECTNLFAKVTDEKSPEFTKFAPLIKKFVTDSNAVAQEKALDAVLSFVENAHISIAGRTAADCISGIVAKCFSSPKKTTQEKALDIILMYCEIEKYEVVQEELIKGFSQKNPKVVCACIRAVSSALREFGNKVISIKPLVKSMGPLLEDRDKNVRDEGKKMVVEMYRWVGAALNPQLTSLKPIQIQELEAEFDKIPKERPVQTRFLRSQQELKAKAEVQDDGQEVGAEDGDEDVGEEIDPFDLMTPVNILEKLPKDFYEEVEAKKWQERKKAMDTLLPLTQNARLEPGDYSELVKALKKIIGKDTNVMIIALAGQCLCGIAKGLKKKFSPYAISCMETIFEKFKEKKINVVTALRDAIDAIFQSTNIEAIQEISCAALNNKNPNVKSETASFLARAFCYCTPTVLTKKTLKGYITELLKTLNESDANVRESSAEALGTALKVVGEKTMTPFISDVDALKMQKIREYSEKAEIKVKIKPVKAKPAPKSAPPKEAPKPVARPPSKGLNGRPGAAGKRPATAGVARAKKPGDQKGGGGLDDEDFYDAVEDTNFAPDTDGQEDETDSAAHDNVSRSNISAQITDSLISELGDKNWKVRIEALGKLSTILSNAKFIEADIGELPEALCSRLSDTNKNIAAEALKLTSQLATALGPHCKRHTRIIVPGIFAALGDTKKSMREQALTALNEWVRNLGAVKEVIDGEMCVDALKSGSPFLKAEILTWMSEVMKEAQPKTLNKEELHACVIFVFQGLEDRNADIRKASNEAILPFMLHLGYDGMAKHTSKVKPSSKNTVMQALEKAKVNLPAKPCPPSMQAKGKTPAGVGGRSGSGSSEKPERVQSGGVGRGTRKVGGRIQSGNKAGLSSRKEEDIDTSPLLQVNNHKQQRITEEQRMRTLRWDFATPRPEFVSQLKDQMAAANLNRQLLANMFHQDFKFHIKAIDGLAEDLNANVDSCISNLDLILRWLTIRFFDTNPSVILKAMDYLSNLFTLLSENGYSLTDYEAYSFLPFLVMKFGDPKDAIRGPTKNIINLICNIYPASKVSPYILDGLKSKNARQRAECLETIGSLIENFGMSVCQPSPPAALKEVAKQIADRDNSVRNAALNCLLQVYFRQGEKVYKLIGQISDKDHSLLEERIKRSAKNKPVIKKPVAQETNVPTVRGAIGGGAKPTRVIPSPAAQPAPVLREGGLRRRSFISNASSNPKKESNRLTRDPSYGSFEELEKSCISSFSDNPLPNQHNESVLSPYSSLNHLLSIKNRYGKNGVSEDSGMDVDTGSMDNLCEESEERITFKLPPLNIPRRETPALEQARRISRSLSFILGDFIEEEEDLKSYRTWERGGRPTPIGYPPSLVRTVTSPQFSGYGNRPLSGDIGNANSLQIDYDYIEKLLEDEVPTTTDKNKLYQLEEIPDLDSILEHDVVLPPSRIARPGFTSAMKANVVNANIDPDDASQAINMVISQVATLEVNTVITALSQLDEVIQSDEKRSLLIPHIDQLLIVARFQYRHILTTKMSDETINKEECIRIYRSLTSCLMSIFDNKELGTKASRDVLRDVVHVIISVLLDSRLSSLGDGPKVVRSLNVLAVRIIEKAQFTNIFSALLKLLHESVGSGENPKFTELVMKCNWKGIRILPSRSKDLNPVTILQDAYDFMKAYPSNTWSERPSNTPLRTIKTVIHTLVKVYGNDILSYLSQVPNSQGSELQRYIVKDLNCAQKSSVSDTEDKDSNKLSVHTNNEAETITTGKSPKRLSKSANNTLSEIFKKIGSKENTKEGLVQLYEFKLKNPDADIDSYLRKSSQFFQNYIERGLKKVEMERQGENQMATSASSDGPLSSIQMNDPANVNVSELVDQFKAIAAKAGFDNNYIDSAVKDICIKEKREYKGIQLDRKE